MNVTYQKPSKILESNFETTAEYERLNAGQKKFFKEFFKGKNIFLTGPAGTGKSFCIETLFNYLFSKGVFIGKSALTGVAALNIGGSTIHSWAGLGLADEDADSLKKKALQNKRARDRIRGTGVLFIDEVSMASADLINKIDVVFKHIRGNDSPFGGMQIIFSGDYLQLPFVSKGYGEQLKFGFTSRAWKEAKVSTIHLTKLVRQDENTPFAKMLQELRFGRISDLELIESRIGAKLNTAVEPIRIFCLNNDIDNYNLRKYRELKGQESVYIAKDSGNADRYVNFFDKNCPAPPILRLRVGAQVMLLANVDVENGLVNGSIGTVEGFTPNGPIVKFSNGQNHVVDNHKWEVKEQELDIMGKMRYKVAASRQQVPLKLAWATSTHRQQGSTLEHAIVDLTNAFEYGMCYVALSRVKTLDGLSLVGFHPRKVKAHPECLDFYEALNSKKKKD